MGMELESGAQPNDNHGTSAGHTIVVSNSRGPAMLADFVADLGSGAFAGTKQQAAQCDVVILATRCGSAWLMLSRDRLARPHPNRRDERAHGPCSRHRSSWRHQIASRIEGAHLERDGC
jgi:hypothetical protein